MTTVQRRILENAEAGRRLDFGRTPGRAAAGGWDSAMMSCVRRGWLDWPSLRITDAGLAALGRREG